MASGMAENHDLYLLSPDDGGRRQLTHTPNADEDYPLWSPDGDAIVFSRSTDEGSALVVIDPDDGVEDVLSPTDDDIPVVWSPNGTHIAVTRGSDSERLWLIKVEGGHASRVKGAYTEASAGADWAVAR